jgi:hypothetical protein
VKALVSRLSYGNVVATLALFIALGGGAYALSRNSVGSKEIAKDAVRSSEVKDDRVKGKDVEESSFDTVPSATTADTANSAVTATSADTADTADTADVADVATFAIDAGAVNGLGVLPVRWAEEQAPAPAFAPISTFGRVDIEARCVENIVPTAQTRAEVRIKSDVAAAGADVHGLIGVGDADPVSFEQPNMAGGTSYDVVTAVDQTGPSVAQAELVWQVGQGLNEVMTFSLLVVADEQPSANDCIVAGTISAADL